MRYPKSDQATCTIATSARRRRRSGNAVAQRARQWKHTAIHPAYRGYLDSLAPAGRRAVACRLDKSVRLLNVRYRAETFAWHALSFEQLQRVKTVMVAAGYAPRSINFTLAAMRSVVRQAFHLGLASADQLLRLRAVQPVKLSGKPTGRALSLQEVQQLLALCDRMPNETTRLRNRAMLLVGLGAGLRVSELVQLDVGSVGLESGELRVEQGKGGRFRSVHLPPDAMASVQTWLEGATISQGPLWRRINRGGAVEARRLTTAGVNAIFKQLACLAGVKQFNPHDLRRTFITRLLESGADLNTVRQLAGHMDITTTARYDRRDDTYLRRISTQLQICEPSAAYLARGSARLPSPPTPSLGFGEGDGLKVLVDGLDSGFVDRPVVFLGVPMLVKAFAMSRAVSRTRFSGSSALEAR